MSESSGEETKKVRGRARSHSFTSDDQSFQNDLSAAAASAAGVPFVPVVAAAPSPAPLPQAASDHSRGSVSQRTLNTMRNLPAALALPVDEERGHRSERGGAVSEEALAEAQLESEQRRLRAGEAAGAGGSTASSLSASSASTASTGSPLSSIAALVSSSSSNSRNSASASASNSRTGFDVQLKLLLLGDAKVGKTSLMTRFSENKFSDKMVSTLGVDYKHAFLSIMGLRVKLQIWDTAGQERFRVMTQPYYKGAHGVVLVYDASAESSFLNVQSWMQNIKEHASPTIVKLLLGNKVDLPRAVTTERGREASERFGEGDKGGMSFMETSALDGTNVREAFAALATDIIKAMAANQQLVLPGADGGAGAAGAAAAGGAAKGPGAPTASGSSEPPKKECSIV